jgi:hypothetical protein
MMKYEPESRQIVAEKYLFGDDRELQNEASLLHEKGPRKTFVLSTRAKPFLTPLTAPRPSEQRFGSKSITENLYS